MEKKKDTMIKDAIILCLITLVLGAVLAGVYAITKDPIEQAQAKTNNEACAKVVASGDTVQDNDTAKVDAAAAYFAGHNLSNAEVTDGETLATWVEVTEVQEMGCLGAAMCVGIGTKIFKDSIDAISKCVRVKKSYEPNDRLRPMYDAAFARWAHIYSIANNLIYNR